ncbi:MAG TPA: PEGA domain-containing protein [Opitutales bacterium]|jgi:hypothetical protein|nr:PEGA domain-containing protein [Opitutales bacterium]
MKITKLASLTLLPLSLALITGCSSLKKSSAPATDAATSTAPAAAAPAATDTPAAPAPVKAPKAPVIQDVVINSVPAGATVILNGQEAGQTPYAAKLEVGNAYSIELRLAGYLIDSESVRAASSSGVPIKTGMSTSHPPAFRGQYIFNLAPVKDPFHALQNAVSVLDVQLSRHKITPDEYKQKVAELARFYSQGK